jgi:tRNA(adenine34) deaminase
MKDTRFSLTETDFGYLRRAVTLACRAEEDGNLPIGAVITLDDQAIAEACNGILVPHYHPGRHAEMEAMRRVPIHFWRRSREMTCYTTLEPCVMCMGAVLLHGIGRVVFGATDVEGGAGPVLACLPSYYANGRGRPAWVGPGLPEVCDALYKRVLERFDKLPVGRSNF